MILDDFFKPFQSFFNINTSQESIATQSQNVLTPYQSMCVAGKCLYFDGINDYTTRLHDEDLDMKENGFSVGLWFKTSNQSASSTLVDRYNEGGWKLWLTADGATCFGVDDDATWAGESPDDKACTQTGLDDDTWHYIMAVKNGTSSIQIYADGFEKEEDAVISATGSLSGSSTVVYLGIEDGVNSPFKGFVDEVKIYTYSRTADQVKQDYNAGLAGQSSSKGVAAAFGSKSDSWMSDGLVGYWKMDETATTSGAIDSSGNGNDGTYEGTASTTGGKFGNGGVFDQGDDLLADDYLSINNGSTANSLLDLIENFTISSWIKINEVPLVAASGSCIVCKGSSSGGPSLQYGMFIDNSLKLYIGYSGNESINSIELDKWYNIVVVYNNSGTKPQLFVDGEKWDTNGLGIVPVHFDYNLTIGAVNGFNNYHPFGGNIDEVRVYNRALSKDEVKKLYEWAPGPVLHLKMDEKQGTTAYDTSGYGNNGILTNGPTWDRGKYGSALNFDGSNDWINLNSPSTLEDLPQVTISAWIKPNSDVGARIYTTDTTSSGGYVFYTEANGVLTFGVDGTGNMTHRSSNDSLTIGEWQHISATWSGLMTAANSHVFINGIEVSYQSTIDGSGTWSDAGYDKSIGGRVADSYFNGLIDDVKVYNYARTQKQILEDMNGGRPASKSPVAYWKFDEGYGATVHDESGNGNDGVASSSTSGTNTNVSEMWSLDGKFNKAMEFDGTNDAVYLSNNNLRFGTGDYSGSLWFKILVKSQAVLLQSYNLEGFEANAWELRTDIFSGKEGIGLFESFVSTNEPEKNNSNSLIGFSEANYDWHHLVFSVDKSKAYTSNMYLDGKLLSSTSSKSNLSVSSSTPGYLFIGRSFSGDVFNGLIDEVKIFNYALSEDEVKQEYNQGFAAVMGSSGTDSSGNADNSSSRKYCVPGDSSTCNPPVLELKMDEKEGTTAYDTSGNGNDGTISGATWGRGKIGSALKFGVDDNMMTPFSDPGSTMSTWIKLSGYGKNNEGAIISLGGWYLLHVSGFGELVLETNNFTGSEDKWSSDNNVLDLNQWYHVAVVLGGPDFYIDGEKITVTQDVVHSGAPLFPLGVSSQIGRSSFDGIIDDVKIYNYARTPAQIAWDYNKGAPIAEYRFDEGQGTIAHDESPSASSGQGGNDGTITIGGTGDQTSAGNSTDGLATSAWYNGVSGAINKSLGFDGTDDYISIGDTNLDINAISFWTKQDYTDNYFLDLDGGTSTITLASGNIQTTGFTSPTVYVDGLAKTNIPNNAWHQVTVVTDTAMDAN
ncbi:MAG: LamG domain-containing protein, partial [Prolixibacteraceae bacterium]|nr:LamG domain-containing protein [Prolixibacteraceae bacterium]